MRFSAIADNPPRIFDHQRWTEWLAQHRGQRIEIEVRDEGAIHSDRQRRYWFGCVVQTVLEIKSRERGQRYSKEAIHGMLMRVFASDLLERAPDGGQERPSFSTISKTRASALIDAVGQWLWDDYQVVLPSPEEWSDV